MCFLSTSLCPAVSKAKISVYAVASYNLERYKTQLGSVTGTALKAPRGWLPSVKVPVRKLASVPAAQGRPEKFQTQDRSSAHHLLPVLELSTRLANFTDAISRPPGREFSPTSPSTTLPYPGKTSLIGMDLAHTAKTLVNFHFT